MNEIFIFAQTRSGSTLLQRAINQTEDVIIYGEHGGLLHGYAAAYYTAFDMGLAGSRFEPEKLKDPEIFAPCASCIEPIQFKSHMRKFTENVLNPARSFRWGFKEVRYGKHENCKVFYMLAELFPTAQFVFLVRDPREQIRSVVSMKWETFDAAYNYWRNTFLYFNQCKTDLPDRCRFITYQHLRHAGGLFLWLHLNNPMFDLFKDMPRTGETKDNTQLDTFQKWHIEQQCVPLYENTDYL